MEAILSFDCRRDRLSSEAWARRFCGGALGSARAPIEPGREFWVVILAVRDRPIRVRKPCPALQRPLLGLRSGVNARGVVKRGDSDGHIHSHFVLPVMRCET